MIVKFFPGSFSAINIFVFVISMNIMHTYGEIRTMTYTKSSGSVKPTLRCAVDAGSKDFLATKYDGTNSCTGIDWEYWGTSAGYNPSSSYYEKTHFVEVYKDPLVLGGSMRLPIQFYPGSYIDMHIEFTSDSFSQGIIQLLDVVDGNPDVYSGDSETIMIRMEMHPTSNHIIFKTWWFGWVNHAFITPYPFTAGTFTKITFKALTNELQILFDDVEVDRYTHYVPPEDAKLLDFSNVGDKFKCGRTFLQEQFKDSTLDFSGVLFMARLKLNKKATKTWLKFCKGNNSDT